MSATVTQESNDYSNELRTVEFQITASASDGSIPDTAVIDSIFPRIQGWFLISAEAIPGTPPPSNNADLQVNNEHGLDILGGNGTDLISSTVAQAAVPSIGSHNTRMGIHSGLSISVSGNSVSSAKITIILNFARCS